MSNPVAGNLEKVFKECDKPTDQDDPDKACVLKDIPFFKLEVTVPGKSHEEIGNNQ